jgi:hypothetical protein
MKTFTSKKRKIEDIKLKQVKRIKISFPNELILEIFKFLVIDLLCVDVRIAFKKKSDPLLPLNVVRNMRLISKEYKNLFEICFKDKFSERYKVDLCLKGGRGYFFKNVVRSSVIYLSSLRTQNKILMMDGDYSMNCEINRCENEMCDVFRWLGCFNVFYEMFYILNIPLDEFFCSCGICRSIRRRNEIQFNL